MSVEEVFVALGCTAIPSGCWIPRHRANDGGGYRTRRVRGQKWYIHRLAYVLVHGPIDDGLEILHSCDNPSCCNPAHLTPGTHAENMADKAQKGRAPVTAGAIEPRYDDSIIARARFLRDEFDMSYGLIAMATGLSESYISRICRGERRAA